MPPDQFKWAHNTARVAALMPVSDDQREVTAKGNGGKEGMVRPERFELPT